MSLPFLNIFFIVFHTALTLFNITGWAIPKTRKLHLVSMLLTAGSWFILGIWFGWGYCLCTDWHWQVREAMGIHDRSDSYIHFLLEKVTGIEWNRQLVEDGTLFIFVICLLLSIGLNIKDRRNKRFS
jgi:hypothetical protein